MYAKFFCPTCKQCKGMLVEQCQMWNCVRPVLSSYSESFMVYPRPWAKPEGAGRRLGQLLPCPPFAPLPRCPSLNSRFLTGSCCPNHATIGGPCSKRQRRVSTALLGPCSLSLQPLYYATWTRSVGSGMQQFGNAAGNIRQAYQTGLPGSVWKDSLSDVSQKQKCTCRW